MPFKCFKGHTVSEKISKIFSPFLKWLLNFPKNSITPNTSWHANALQMLQRSLITKKFHEWFFKVITVKSLIQTAVSIDYFQFQDTQHASIWGRLLKNCPILTKIGRNWPKCPLFWLFWQRLQFKGGFYFNFAIDVNGAVTIWGRFLFKGG